MPVGCSGASDAGAGSLGLSDVRHAHERSCRKREAAVNLSLFSRSAQVSEMQQIVLDSEGQGVAQADIDETLL